MPDVSNQSVHEQGKILKNYTDIFKNDTFVVATLQKDFIHMLFMKNIGVQMHM